MHSDSFVSIVALIGWPALIFGLCVYVCFFGPPHELLQ